MSESLHVTIVYETGEDGWIVASIPEVPGAHSQGHTREEARANVIDALRGILELRDAAKLEPGAEIEVEFRDGQIETSPAAVPKRLVGSGARSVIVAEGRMPSLSADDVRDVVEHTRR